MKRHILIATLALLALTATAQHDEQVTVEGKYRPKVNKVNKLQLTPETPQPSYAYPSTEVNPKEAKQKFALDLEKIAPTGFAAKKDQLVTPTQNFLMAGLGTRLSPVFLYKHNSMLTKTLGLGVGIKHNSSWLNIKDYAPSSYMNNAFDVNLTTSKFDGIQLDGGVFYKNDMVHYYGVNLAEMPLTDEQIEQYCPRQTYNTIGGHLGIASTSTRVGELNHSGTLDYQYTFDRFDSQEHYAGLDYGLGYAQNWWGDKDHPQKVGLDLGFQYVGFSANEDTENRIFFKVNPFFEMKDEFYRLHLGVRMDGATTITEDDKFLAVRPDVSGSLFILNKKLEFYAGLNGGKKMLRFGEIVEENPFFAYIHFPNHSFDVFRSQNVKLGFEGGVRTNIAEIVDLHLGVRYRHTENDPFYVLEYEYVDNECVGNKFALLYYETKLVTVMADIRVKMRNSLTADMGFAYNSCKPTFEEYAWYRPTTEGKLKLTYTFNDDLSFNASFLYQGGRYALVRGDDDTNWLGWIPERIKDVFDLSLGADYKVNDQITAFALLDNVAHQKYQLYYNYPVTGIQFFAGVKLRF
ncbi:MAG: hypothetical protein IKI09_10005 [Bacteroidales bacterium]|nr:hypothetical protein [Bacteroidales bacterium]